MNLKAKKASKASELPKGATIIAVDGSLFDWAELDPERAAEYLRLKNHAAEIIESLRPIHDAMYALRMDTAQDYRNAQGGNTSC
jgi:hypothetical protein